MSRSLIQFNNSKDLGAWYDAKYTEMGGGWKVGPDEAKRLMEWSTIPKSPENKLLDIGCGDGDFISHVTDYGHWDGIDLSEVGIQFANARQLKNVCFKVADIETFDVVNYDHLVSIGSIEHVVDLDKALKNCFSILKDRGTFLCLVPNELWPHMDQPHEQTHTDTEWIDIFQKAGFRINKFNRRNDLTDFLFIKII